ncbi:MAG: hypothetical protein V3U96_00395 [Paracoccaceae bacterium]
MATLENLIRLGDNLRESRASGVMEVEDQNGERVRYKSDQQMAAALADLDRQITEIQGRATPSSFHFQTSKGV